MTSVPIEVGRDHDRIRMVQARYDFHQERDVLTSQDEKARAMMDELPATGLRGGFAGKLIPIVFGPGTGAVVTAEAEEVGTTTGEHFHYWCGFHQILTGAVAVRRRVVRGVEPLDVDTERLELTAGHWVHVPTGVLYVIEILAPPLVVYYHHGANFKES